MSQTLIFIAITIIGIIVYVILRLRKSQSEKAWQDDDVYDRLKMLEDGWSIDKVLEDKRTENTDAEDN